MNMRCHLLLGVLFFGSANADGWDDFTNNLATDLAPLLALFGEQVTKQFLSESTTIWDNFIFAMAPLGIITAVVSAIRVCGGPSLRAFIGRAQEGGGIAEAELCSSTSRDVCELFHNGAIVRVFGRPKILEIFHHPDAAKEKLPWESQVVPICGIYSFQQYVDETSFQDSGWEEVCKSEKLAAIWHKTRKHLSCDLERSYSASGNDSKETRFSPNPNLSLNIGIKRLPQHTMRMASVFAFIAQISVLVFGCLTTLWDWKKDGQSPPPWGLPLTLIGTTLLCGGMFHCALLIERSTKERVFRRVSRDKTSNGKRSHESTMYVVQPGNQIIGDQTFDSFIFDGSANGSRPVNHYTTSWKEPRRPENEWRVWCAVTTTLFGFILQFVGLRAMHSAISLLQLGVIMIVSILRASLRTQRLREEDNLLHKFQDEIQGHELDWLAHCMTKDEEDSTDKQEHLRHPSWKFTGQKFAAYPHAGLSSSARDNVERSSSLVSDDTERRDDQSQASTIGTADRAVKIFYHRARLAELTSRSIFVNLKSSSEWDEGAIEVRKHARKLKEVIESSSKILFRNGSQHSETNAIPLSWNLQVECSDTSLAGAPSTILMPTLSNKPSEQPLTGAEVNIHFLEAVLGLWSWSIISEDTDRTVERNNTKGCKTWKTPALRLLAIEPTETGIRNAEKELRLWYDHMIMSSPIIMETPENFMRSSANKVWHEEVVGQSTVGKLHEIENSNRRPEGRRRMFGRQYYNKPSTWALTSRLSPDYSISMACSHDIYQSFLYAIVQCFESIGGHTKSSKGIDGLYLVNDVIDGLVECFREGGLGTRSEAMTLLLPVLQNMGKLPSPPRSWFKNLIVGEDQKKDEDLSEREYILQGAWVMAGKMEDRQDPVFEAVMLEIGELYRKALYGGNEDNKKFAEQGFKWMQSQKDTSNETIKEIVDRYLNVAMKGVVPGPKPTLDQIVSAIQKSNRTETLRLVSLIRELPPPPDMNHSNICWIARQEWPEIVKDLMELGCEVDVQDQEKRTPLSYAAENGCFEVAEILLRNGAQPMVGDREGRTPISFAASGGHKELLRLLSTDSRVILSGTDKNGLTPLHWAARNGMINAVTELLDQPLSYVSELENRSAAALLLKHQRVEPDTRDEHEQTPLWWAASCGHYDVVSLLLDTKGVDMNIRNRKDQTPIAMAACEGYARIVKLLLERGADLTIANDEGKSPLHKASEKGHVAIVALLLDKGADLITQDKDGNQPLHAASFGGHVKVVGLLLEKGAETTVMNVNGRTPLFEATVNDNVEVARLLIEKGASVSQETANGQTPLYEAAAKGYIEVAKLLIANGADVAVINRVDYRFSPLHAASNAGHAEMAELLLDEGAELGATELNGWTPLHVASEAGHGKIAKLLLERGADVSNRNDDPDWTPLFAASVKGHTSIVELLLSAGADASLANHQGRTPLNTAATNGHTDIVLLLLDKGADVNCADSAGMTPLLGAATNGHMDIVLWLLDKGADVNWADSTGMTPLLGAATNGHMDIVQLFLDKRSEMRIEESDIGTSFRAACNSGQTDVVKLFLDKRREFSIGKNVLEKARNEAWANRQNDSVVLLEQTIKMTSS